MNLDTLEKTRLYQSTYTDKIENIQSIEDFKKGEVLVQIQSKSDYPNFYFRNIKDNTLKAITQFKNPYEGLKGVSKEVIKYLRKDGVQLSGTLYLPLAMSIISASNKLFTSSFAIIFLIPALISLLIHIHYPVKI